jgi:hypothetical protein
MGKKIKFYFKILQNHFIKAMPEKKGKVEKEIIFSLEMNGFLLNLKNFKSVSLI